MDDEQTTLGTPNETNIEPGDFVGDMNQDLDEALVIAVTDTPASERSVGTTGKVVSEWPGNEEYPADDVVVRATYVSELDGQFGVRWRAWSMDRLYQEASRADYEVQTYDFPKTRLLPTGESLPQDLFARRKRD